ncbi:26491_t:CDS:2, partial [Racocetra persica]
IAIPVNQDLVVQTTSKFLPTNRCRINRTRKNLWSETYSAKQIRYNSLIQRRINSVDLNTPAITSDGQGTLLRWP